jgi:hypothetical protein
MLAEIFLNFEPAEFFSHHEYNVDKIVRLQL